MPTIAMPVKKVLCVSCGAENHPNSRTCSSCGNAYNRKKGRGGVGGRGVKPVKVNRPEGETLRPQRSIQPLIGCSSINDTANPHRSVTVVADDPSPNPSQPSLVCKRGRPAKTSNGYTEPCPTCGEQNSLLNADYDHCQQSLMRKRGRPTKTSEEYSTQSCSNCGEQNS